MDNNIPYDLTPDDDTEEMEAREYRPISQQLKDEFPKCDKHDILRRILRLEGFPLKVVDDL